MKNVKIFAQTIEAEAKKQIEKMEKRATTIQQIVS